MFPTVDAAGEDRWVKVSVIIPKDANEEDGTDGYSLAREYQLKVDAAEERARKAKEKAETARAKAAAKAAAKAEK
jgi:predicted Zn-dependent protease